MTAPRKLLVDPTVTRWYHCISKCVRDTFLMSEQAGRDRKQWIEDRLQILASSFAVSVGGFAVLDNHLHVLVRLDVDTAKSWSSEEVVRRWIAIYPPRGLDPDDPKALQNWIEKQVNSEQQVAEYRARLANLGWFMKSLKEPFARMCNKADGKRGTFWDARYKSIAVLDEEALLATCIYIDLNPVAAGVAKVPEKSKHTSIKQRVEHAKTKGALPSLNASLDGSVAGSDATGNLEQDQWLVPIEDRRQLPGAKNAGAREGMFATLSLGSYLLLIEHAGRIQRDGKASICGNLQSLFDRLGIGERTWGAKIGNLLGSRDLRGNVFASQSERIAQLNEQRGRRTINLSPQFA